MLTRLFTLSIVLIFSILNFSAQAEGTWHINPNHSQVRFEVPFMGVSSVEGRFDQFRGSAEVKLIDDVQAQLAKAEVILMVTGLTTGSPGRDRHLKGPDFFYSSLYPRFKIILPEVNLNIDEESTVAGQLTLKDVTKEVPITLRYLGLKLNKEGQRSAFFSATATISRKLFNLGWNQYLTQNDLLLGDEIEVSAHVETNPFGERPGMGQFFKLNKSERQAFMKERQASESPAQQTDKSTLLLQAKVDTLTAEIEALEKSNEVMRVEMKRTREEGESAVKSRPNAIKFASAIVFGITMLLGLGAGIALKWSLLKPLVEENPKYAKFDRLTDLLLLVMVLSGVAVIGWFFSN